MSRAPAKKIKTKKIEAKAVPVAEDYRLETVATIAAVLKNGNHEITMESAALQALDLLDACRQEMEKRRHPTGASARVDYKTALREITGRTETRFDRIEEAFQVFIRNHPPSIPGLEANLREMDAQGRSRLTPTQEGFDNFLNARKSQGFSREEVEGMKEKYRYLVAPKKKFPE